MGKLLEHASTFLLVLLVMIALFTFIAPIFGWSIDAVKSGSMEPDISTGDLVITKPVSADEIKAGDIITFTSSSKKRLTTHRVIAVGEEGQLQFQTKGDANEDADIYMVPENNVVGKVYLKIPYFGYVSQFIKSPVGFVLTFCIPGVIILFQEVRKLWQARNNSKDTEKGT
jgi:signal peptidase